VLLKCNLDRTNAMNICGKILQFMTQYKIKDTGILHGIVKF